MKTTPHTLVEIRPGNEKRPHVWVCSCYSIGRGFASDTETAEQRATANHKLHADRMIKRETEGYFA